jgi:phosphatidylserine/phosphatidylglycerophosphate/cardiolipin synthase-like enzyme
MDTALAPGRPTTANRALQTHRIVPADRTVPAEDVPGTGGPGPGKRCGQRFAGSWPVVRIDDWFLTVAERGNPVTRLDDRHHGKAWSAGNRVSPLIHGAAYFAELAARIPDMGPGDLLLFTDWRGDPDEQLTDEGPQIADLLCAAARRAVTVRGLVWRSHLDRFRFSEQENRHLGEEIDAAGGQCLLDMRVRPGGSHHMKMVVLRHARRPQDDVAFIGGIDLCHSRRDDAAHRGDPQGQPMAAVYGERPPWHDIQAMIQGPAVADAETVFRERWEDPAPPTRNPMGRLHDLLTRVDDEARRLPPQLPGPPGCGNHAVQLLRTFPRRRPGYAFAPDGEFSIARGYLKALPRARSLIYLEDQYLWSAEVVAALARALRESPAVHLIAVIPRFPDQDGRLSLPPNLIGRIAALDLLQQAGGDRVAIYSPENAHGTPVYVHAKVCVIDDTWAIVGSDNFNRRSWTHDSELSCAVVETTGPGPDGGDVRHGEGTYAHALRVALSREHLGTEESGAAERLSGAFGAFRRSAARLDAWHGGGRAGPRPAGRLRSYQQPALPPWTRAWAGPAYRLVYDPDGRPLSWRRAGRF